MPKAPVVTIGTQPRTRPLSAYAGGALMVAGGLAITFWKGVSDRSFGGFHFGLAQSGMA